MRTFAAVAALGIVACAAWGQDEAATLKSAVEKNAPCIVTVKAVLKTEMKFEGQSQSTEARLNLQGAVVSADGLVMLSNTPFSQEHLMEVMGAGQEAMGARKSTPTSLKVIIGSEEKEYDAFLAATDKNLDLAFIKIEGLGERTLTAVDFASAADPTIGQRVIQVSRLGRGYDYAGYYQTGRVNGEIAKPRTAWMVEGGLSAFGLPVFTVAGAPLGVLSTIAGGSRDDSDAESAAFAMAMRMLAGGGGSGIAGTFVLPGSVIKATIDQAKARAITVAEERAKRKAEGPAAKPATPATAPKPATPATAPKPATPPKPTKPAKPGAKP